MTAQNRDLIERQGRVRAEWGERQGEVSWLGIEFERKDMLDPERVTATVVTMRFRGVADVIAPVYDLGEEDVTPPLKPSEVQP